MKKIWCLLFLVLLIGFSLRVIPTLLESTVDPDPLFHARMSEKIVEQNSLPRFDELSLGGRVYSYPPLFHILIASLRIVSGLDYLFLLNIFPLFYAIASLIAIFFIAMRLFNDKKIALFAVFSLSIMLMHLVRTNSFGRPDALSMFLVLIGVFFLIVRRIDGLLLVSVSIVLLHPLTMLYFAGLLLLLVLLSIFKKIEVNARVVLFVLIISLAVFLVWVFSVQMPLQQYVSNVSFSSSELQKPSMLDFAVFFSFSWVFGLAGFFLKRKDFFLSAWFLLSLVFFAFGFRLGIFLSFPIALLSGFGLNFFYEKVKKFRVVFFFMFFLLALMSIIPFLQSQGKFFSLEEVAAASWIEKNSEKNILVAGEWDRGHLLTYYAKRKILADGYFEFAPGLREKINAVEELRYFSDCEKVRRIVEKFGIDYFFAGSGNFDSFAYNTGLFETEKCDFTEQVFSGSGARIIKYSTN